LKAETLAATAMLSAGVAHELNNPLGVVVGLAELLVIDEDLHESVRADLRVIVKETGRAVQVVRQLLSYGRGGGGLLEVVDVVELAESSAIIFEATRAPVEVTLTRDLGTEPAPVMADAFRLQESLLAIFDNAAKAIAEADRESGRIEMALTTDPEHVTIRITDDGPGIEADDMRRLFDPFFTTREVGKGAGMGLALVHRTVRDFGGQIRCENAEGGGASFVITLDRYTEDA